MDLIKAAAVRTQQEPLDVLREPSAGRRCPASSRSLSFPFSKLNAVRQSTPYSASHNLQELLQSSGNMGLHTGLAFERELTFRLDTAPSLAFSDSTSAYISCRHALSRQNADLRHLYLSVSRPHESCRCLGFSQSTRT